MKKNVFSLLLLLAITSGSFVVASEKVEEVKKEVKDVVAQVPQWLSDRIGKGEKALEALKKNLEKATEELSTENKKEKPDQEAVKDLTKVVEKIKDSISLKDLSVSALKKHVAGKYQRTWVDKLAAPMTKAAEFVANNSKVALFLEATGIAALSYVVYKSFFAAADEDEDFNS